MLQDMILPQEHLSIDEITSPLSAQIFEFCDPELFQETFQTASEVTSGSNCCVYDENSSYLNHQNGISLTDDPEKSGSYQNNGCSNTNSTTTTTTTTTIAAATATTTTTISGATEDNNNNNNNVNDNSNSNSNRSGNNNSNGDLTIIFDSQDDFDNDISAAIDFSSSLQFPVSDHFLGTTSQDQFDFAVQQPQNVLYPSSGDPLALSAGPIVPPLQSSVFEEDCLSSVPSYNVGLNPSSPSCSFLGTAGLPAYMAVAGNLNPALSAESSGFFTGGVRLGSDLQTHDQLIDYQADNGGIFCPDSIHRVFNRGDLQALGGGDSQTHLVTTAATAAVPPAPPTLGTDITGLEDTTFNKVGKLSVEQRKEKIHRYMKKRNERNFSKKIKYACRKTLADSRPRVRGRFAKNDEFGEANRQASSSHDDDDDVGVKEEEEMVDSSDIFSHISGVNSFKCNYPIQSWI